MSTDIDTPLDAAPDAAPDLAPDLGHPDGSPERFEHDEHLVAVRRNVLLAGVVGGLALLLGSSYLLRGASAFDTLVGLLLVGVAGLNLPTLAGARVPILVADEQGVRFRIGFGWRGLPWREIRQVVVEHPESMLREGRLVIVPRDPSAVETDSLPGRAHLRWNQAWYGAPLSLPLGLTTVTDSRDLAADLTAMAEGRTEIVSLRGAQFARLEEIETRRHATPDPVAVAAAFGADDAFDDGFGDDYSDDHGDDFRAELHGDLVQGLVVGQPEAPVTFEAPVPEEPLLPSPVMPLRDLYRPNRVDVRLDEPVVPRQSAPDHDAADHDAPIELVVDEPATDLDVRPPGAEVPHPGDLAREQPRPTPVIGEKVQHAREMLDMDIDELSQRTRIRPHVLEAIELDDFGPCGGDFYARGHLTAVARVLGLNLAPLLKTYDEQYAQAPINARRVFEADLSTGLSGGMRATLGGPRWSLVIGAVLSLTMIWGLARMFAGDPEQLTAAPDSNAAAGLAANQKPITSPRMRTTSMSVTAAHAATHVIVRDRTNKILWSGDLAIGRHRKIVGLAPFKVSADNAGAVEVTVKGKALGTIGTAGESAAKSFG